MKPLTTSTPEAHTPDMALNHESFQPLKGEDLGFYLRRQDAEFGRRFSRTSKGDNHSTPTIFKWIDGYGGVATITCINDRFSVKVEVQA